MLKVLGVLPFVLINLNSTSKFLDNLFLKEENFYYENKSLIVRGNIDNLDSSSYLQEKPNKNLLIFDCNSKIDNEYCGFFYDFKSDKTFYLETNSTDLSNLRDDLKTFYLESINKEKINEIGLTSIDNETLFKEIRSSTISKVAKPYGRMAFTYSLKEYEYNTISSLYLLEVKQQFICGYNCTKNDEKGFDYYFNYDQYVHIGAYQSEAQMGYDDILKSGIPKFKDAYPNSEPGNVTITSSYQSGVTFGFSLKGGFARKKITGEAGGSYEKNIEEEYSKTYTLTCPRLTSQISQDLIEYQWNYYYNDEVDYVTNTQYLGYMFECNRYQNGIDTHNKFDIRISAKASYAYANPNIKKDVYFNKTI